MNAQRLYYRRLCSWLAMGFGALAIISGSIIILFGINGYDPLFFFAAGLAFLLFFAKYVFDFNEKNKRNDVLWLLITLVTAITMFVFGIIAL